MATRAEHGSGCGCWLTRAAVRKDHGRKQTTFMNAEINTTRDLLITAIDLTRACCAQAQIVASEIKALQELSFRHFVTPRPVLR